MNNNDRLVRLRYALDIKDNQMVEIFQHGGMQVTVEEVQELLRKVRDENTDRLDEDLQDNEYEKVCDNATLDAFLNGLIVFHRGVQEPKPGAKLPQPEQLHDRNVNNLLLKRVKIALSLTSEDMLDILDEAGIRISNSELSAVLRREGHRNYKPCGDRYARNFLKGLALRYRM